MRAKKEMIRVVRTPEGSAHVDGTGRANGRGAYLCRDTTCYDKAMKTRALNRALEVTMDTEALNTLRNELVNASGPQTP